MKNGDRMDISGFKEVLECVELTSRLLLLLLMLINLPISLRKLFKLNEKKYFLIKLSLKESSQKYFIKNQ